MVLCPNDKYFFISVQLKIKLIIQTYKLFPKDYVLIFFVYFLKLTFPYQFLQYPF